MNILLCRGSLLATSWNPDLISFCKDCTGNTGPHLPLCPWAKLPDKGHGIHPSHCHFETEAFLGDHRELWLLCPGRFLLVDLGMWWQKGGWGRAVVTLQWCCAESWGDCSTVSSVLGWLLQLEQRYISFCSSYWGLISFVFWNYIVPICFNNYFLFLTPTLLLPWKLMTWNENQGKKATRCNSNISA